MGKGGGSLGPFEHVKNCKEMTMKETKLEIKDPICGMRVDEKTALHLKKNGKDYYFCGKNCETEFMSKAIGIEPENKSGGCCG